jgi:BppU N-terminal domain
MAGTLRQYDIGSVIRVMVRENGSVFNASAATTKTLKLQKPSGEVAEVAAIFQTDGSNGVLQYTTIANDLDETGPWTGQLFLAFPSGSWHTEPFNFNVGSNLS